MPARIERTECKFKTKRKKKPIKIVKKKPVKKKPKPQRDAHPSECDYTRYAGKVRDSSPINRTFQRTAKLMGEVEAGLEAFWRIARHHGLMAAPSGDEPSATICAAHARLITGDVDKLQAILSTEAKLLLPIIFMLVGDKGAAKTLGVELDDSEAGEETIH